MKKNKITTSLWDPAEHLETKEDMVVYLESALEEGDPALISAVLGDIARAKGMGEIADKSGLGRTSLYKALSPEGNPEFSTVLKVINALGLRLQATVIDEADLQEIG
jgi:probable addiction module antidote protein